MAEEVSLLKLTQEQVGSRIPQPAVPQPHTRLRPLMELSDSLPSPCWGSSVMRFTTNTPPGGTEIPTQQRCSPACQVDEEPLVVLPCGHAFLMGGLDELLELEWRERSSPEGGGSEMRGCYVRGSDGAWLEPAPLQVGRLGRKIPADWLSWLAQPSWFQRMWRTRLRIHHLQPSVAGQPSITMRRSE